MRAGHDILGDAALAVGERVGEQRHTARPTIHSQPVELRAARRGEPFRDDALILVKDVHAEDPAGVDRLLRASPSVQTHQQHRRVQRQRRHRTRGGPEVLVAVPRRENRYPTGEVTDDVPKGLLARVAFGLCHAPPPSVTLRWPGIADHAAPAFAGQGAFSFNGNPTRRSSSSCRVRQAAPGLRFSVRRKEPLRVSSPMSIVQ